VFVTVTHLHLSLIFARKARAYPRVFVTVADFHPGRMFARKAGA